MSPSILTQALLEETHTAADYLQWVQSLISRVKGEPEGLERIRLRKGLAQELMNEALPIGLLASAYFDQSSQVSIGLKVGSQNFDAVVSDSRESGSSVQHIEVTLANDGEEDYLRMCVLHESGEVSGLGAVVKTGTQRTGLNVHVESEMVSQTEVLRREADRITRALERKQGKGYPPRTLLLVALDDVMAFDRPDNVANIEGAVVAQLPHLAAFHSVALVGLKRRFFRAWSR